MTSNANLACHLVRTAEAHPDSTVLILDENRVSYRELLGSAQALAGVMRAEGVQAGDRVALMFPNVPAYPVLFFAAQMLGAVVVPMNPLFKAREIEYYLQDSGAKQLWTMPHEHADAAAETAGTQVFTVGAEGLAPYLERGDEPVTEVAEKSPDDDAVILYTSGTTGRPKGAELTHNNLHTNLVTVVETLVHMEHGTVVMGCLPLFHVFGLTCSLLTAVYSGATLTMIPRFDPHAALRAVERDKVNVFLGVPTMYGALLAAAAAAGDDTPDTSTLELAVSGGASMPVEILRKFEERFNCTILEGYGLSETSPAACFNHPDGIRKAGSIGQPIRGCEMTVDVPEEEQNNPDAVGELLIRGENIMKGYWNRPDATAEAIDAEGWFHSGDLARRDEDGCFYIVDRKKDMIIRGGYNVYPREIEEVLYEHPAVAEAAVLGVHHEELGQEVAAFVVLSAGAEATEQELVEHVKSRVAAYKYPRHLTILSELPKTATGKILKRELVPTS